MDENSKMQKEGLAVAVAVAVGGGEVTDDEVEETRSWQWLASMEYEESTSLHTYPT